MQFLESVGQKIEVLLRPHHGVLPAGYKFRVTIGMVQVPISETVVNFDPTRLFKSDWEKILTHRWNSGYRMVLETLHRQSNRPIGVLWLPVGKRRRTFSYQDREAINKILKRARFPYVMVSLDRGVKGRWQLVRLL